MYQDSKRTCTVIVLLIKPFVWCRSRRRRRHGLLKLPIIWPAPRAGKMNQILLCDRLPYLSRSGLPAAFRKKEFPESHVINPLLTKLVRSRWLDIGLVLFVHERLG